MSRPYGSVGLAVSRAPVGAIVAVGRGVFTGRVDLFSDVTVWGACPDETVLMTNDVGETETVVGAFLGGSVALRNVTVRGTATMGIYIDGPTTARLQDVVVDGAAGYGVYATAIGTVLNAENLLVRNVARFASGNAGIGLQIVDGANANLQRIALERNVTGQLVVAFDSRATIDFLSARGVGDAGDPTRRGETGIAVQMGGHLTLNGAAIDANDNTGLLVALGSELVANDVAIRDTGNGGTRMSSAALEVRSDSTAIVSGALIERARGAAVILAEQASLTLSDSVILDTRPSTLADNGGLAASLEGSSHLTLVRVLIDHSRRGGIVSRESTTLDATDLVLRNTEASGPRGLGAGMFLTGLRASLTRVIVEGSRVIGIGVTGATATLDAHDLVVRDTQSDTIDGFYGRGLDLNLGAQITGDRVLLERNREVSVFVFDPATRAHFSNLVIRDSLEEQCAPSCASGGLGHGATVLGGATLELEGFVITRSALLGVQVGEGGTLTATRGEISSGPIGINVQEPTFDLATAVREVTFRALERSLDTNMLPIPDTGLNGL